MAAAPADGREGGAPPVMPPARRRRARAAARALPRLLLLLCLLLPPVLSLPAARAVADDAATPILRIETARHGSRMNDVVADATGRLLLTVGDDKTARMWSLPSLRPLGVLRPEIGPRSEGSLYAVAISPDGAVAAVGGFRAEILVFDLRGRTVIRRFTNLSDSVLSLAFSPDGQSVAAGFGGKGVRVLRLSDGATLADDGDYAGGVYGLDFARDGRLAASSLDGSVRLYDQHGTRVARVPMQAGRRPTHLRFSPDGALLAVGFNDAMAVEIRSGATLQPRARPSVAGLVGRSLEAVAWSIDGQTLYAAGATLVKGSAPVFAWSGPAFGTRRIVDRGFASQAIALTPLPDGSVAFGSIDADLAVVRPDGRRAGEVSPVRAEFAVGDVITHPSRQFRLAADGTRVEWVPLAAQTRYSAFDATELAAADEAQPEAFLADWTADTGGLQVGGWDGGPQPRLRGLPLPIEHNERAESVSVRNDRVLLGTQWLIRLYDEGGRPLWSTRLPAPAWRVNQSPDGRLAVAALGDGTLRWYRMRDGRELLAVFLTRADGRWIAFTPSGYYATSPGGEDLIGWHLNRGPDRLADFFPASRFRDRFYRPDIVRLVLAKLDEADAVRVADAARGVVEAKAAPITEDLPPVLTIVSPVDGAQVSGGDIQVEYAVRSPSGRRLRGLRVLVDGLPVSDGRGGGPPPQPSNSDAEVHATVAVPVPAGRSVVIALLADTDSRTSEPAKVSLRGAALPAAPAPRATARLNAVLVGVSAYNDRVLRPGVEYAADDATALREVLEHQRGLGLYREVNTKLLVDGAATREGVVDALEWLRRQTTSNDIAVVFLAGHGVDDEGRVSFLPVGGDMDRLTSTGLSQSDLLDLLRRVAGRKVAFLDFCHAGGAVLAQNTRGGGVDIVGLLNQLREPGSGLITFAAATAHELAIQLAKERHGAFTLALLDALNGGADPQQRGAVGTADLNVFIADEVRTLTDGKQHPIMQRADDIPDFPLVVTR